MSTTEMLKSSLGKRVIISTESEGKNADFDGSLFDIREKDGIVILKNKLLFWEYETLIKLKEIVAVSTAVLYES